MRLRLIPREERFFADFVTLADRIVSAATLLDRMLSSDPPAGDTALQIATLSTNATPSHTKSSSDSTERLRWNVRFSIDSAARTKLRSGETQFMLKGVVTQANNPASVGLPVRILTRTNSDRLS
jgi:hypothetical protein